MRVLIAVVLSLAVVAAVPPQPNGQSRIVGGSLTTIDVYPEIVSLLRSAGTTGHRHDCGGSILNNRSILTAAHCISQHGTTEVHVQTRVGSSYANSGGVVHTTALLINHPDFSSATLDNDIAIIRTVTAIAFNNIIQPGRFANTNYFLADNEEVWAAGWGLTTYGGNSSEQLRHVQVWVVNQNVCNARYGTLTDNMLCAGWLDVGGRDTCQQDSGGPLYHNGVVVGITSWGDICGSPFFPGVSVRVSRFANWIESNA